MPAKAVNQLAAFLIVDCQLSMDDVSDSGVVLDEENTLLGHATTVRTQAAPVTLDVGSSPPRKAWSRRWISRQRLTPTHFTVVITRVSFGPTARARAEAG